MSSTLPLTTDKKLKVTFRVEPGCLGPEGANYIVAFCDYAQKHIASLYSDYIIWNIIPRHDKKLPEMEYNVRDKNLSYDQADKYLAIFRQSLEQFECALDDKITLFIDEFMQKNAYR